MDELQKIVRVLKKVDPAAPHDGAAGARRHDRPERARPGRDLPRDGGVTGLVMTKLDGTAKGGVVVALAEKFGLPIHAIGVGESADDLRPFEAAAFARALLGLKSVKSG